jgi:hypothetical protein
MFLIGNRWCPQISKSQTLFDSKFCTTNVNLNANMNIKRLKSNKVFITIKWFEQRVVSTKIRAENIWFKKQRAT